MNSKNEFFFVNEDQKEELIKQNQNDFISESGSQFNPSDE
jgi:hypothetical protein